MEECIHAKWLREGCGEGRAWVGWCASAGALYRALHWSSMVCYIRQYDVGPQLVPHLVIQGCTASRYGQAGAHRKASRPRVARVRPVSSYAKPP